MGTPEFAVPSLAAIVGSRHKVVGVITAPDRPSGRGLQVRFSAVKHYALEHKLKIMQPEKLRSPNFIEDLKSLEADLQVVVAFRMLPEIVWSMSPLGTFNLHASLLPQYRGAAPINWAVINGEEETGVSTFFLQHEIDTGDLLFQEKVAIGENETAGELHDHLSALGAGLVLRTVDAIADNNTQSIPQPEMHIKFAPKISKNDARINWQKSLEEVHNLVRGMNPVPGSWTMLDDKVFKIYSTRKELSDHTYTTGKVIIEGENVMKIALPSGFLQLLEVQMEGKRKMSIPDFLKGYRGSFNLE